MNEKTIKVLCLLTAFAAAGLAGYCFSNGKDALGAINIVTTTVCLLCAFR